MKYSSVVLAILMAALGVCAVPSATHAEFFDGLYSGSVFNDGLYSGSSFSDGLYSGSTFNDGLYSAASFNDGLYSGSTFSDGLYSGTVFNDGLYSGTTFNDGLYSGTVFNDGLYSGSTFNDGLYSGTFRPYDLVSGTFRPYELVEQTSTFRPYELTSSTFRPYELVSQPMTVTTAQAATGQQMQVYNEVCKCYTSAPVQQQQVYSQACQCYQTIPSYGSAYAQSYMPYASNPMIAQYYPQQASYPQYPSYPQQPRPQPQQPSNYTSNYCTGGSCNTSIVDNSINGSFNDYSVNHSFNTTPSTAVIYPVTAQPIVSYQIPSYTYPSYSYTQGAYCVITASPTSIANGQASYLTWSSNGTSAWLSDGIGAVAANGSLAVRPNTTRTYVLTVSGIYGSNTCSVTINVAGTAPYVALSQIPYTGFDLGVIGNTIYWMGLAALALALSYLVLYFKGGAVAFAGSMFSRPVAVAHTAPVHADYTDHAPAPVAHAVLPTHEESSMKDTMSITRSADGTPRIVINRA